MPESRSHSKFGGTWTEEKLRILEHYLKAYTTALKKQSFQIMYIDAFAGTGSIQLNKDEDKDGKNFISGSAERAIKVEEKPFDKLIFVEQNEDRYKTLKVLQNDHSERDIEVVNNDANSFLQNLEQNWRSWRGVLFLDPFATEVEWRTIETISSFNALDTWILFPTSAIARMLPISKRPDDISEELSNRLTRIYGDASWAKLYDLAPQRSLFPAEIGDEYHRDSGVGGLLSIYKENLSKLFGKRFLETTRTFKNSKNSPLFEFIFCVGNPAGIGPAQNIAKHILGKI